MNNTRYSSARLIIRQREPTNLETPFDRIDSCLTPTAPFYIRSHVPRLTPEVERNEGLNPQESIYRAYIISGRS
ncbi:hypothetical protein C7I87_06175 [Mesorhizobium sp. SARCC-RB16n]|nr:hypothetical protein C7I87_06175 [Mesorhizobium sp. SARCC-RB16n]